MSEPPIYNIMVIYAKENNLQQYKQLIWLHLYVVVVVDTDFCYLN